MRLPLMSTPARPNHARDRWILLLLALIILGTGFGLRDPWPSDEPRFALVAKLMVETGEWIIPHRGHEIYGDKPPFLFWLQGGLYWLLGSLRIAFLLPSLLSGLLVIALVYDLARRLWCHQTALLSAGMLLISIQFAFQMRAAQIDALLLGIMTFAAYGLLRHLLLGPAWGWYWAAWFAAGIGAITKGVGPLVLLLLVPYGIARWRTRGPLYRGAASNWRWWVGPLFLIAAAGIWLGPLSYSVLVEHDPAKLAYVHEIFYVQTARRYVDPTGHFEPWYYLIGVATMIWMPLTLALPWALGALKTRFARFDPRVCIPLVWIGMMFVFFSISPGKRDVYILPALPMFALALAPLLPGIVRQRGFQLLCFAVALTIAALLVLAALFGEFGDLKALMRLTESRSIDPWPLVGTIGVLGLIAVGLSGVRRGLLGFGGVFASVWIVYGLWGYPLLNDARSAKGVMQDVGRMIGPDAELALIGWKEQNLLQADRRVTEFGFKKPWPEQERLGHAWLISKPDRRWIFLQQPNLAQCFDASKAKKAGRANRRDWYLVNASAAKAACE